MVREGGLERFLLQAGYRSSRFGGRRARLDRRGLVLWAAATSLLLLLPLALLPLSSAADPIAKYCNRSFKSGQTQANIDRVLADLVARASVGGFATSTSGFGAGAIYGLAQCRGDVSADDCSECLAGAARELPAACPGQADARVWYDFCFARYSNESFFGRADTGFATILINVENATDPEAFDREAGAVVARARAAAVAAGSGGLGRAKEEFTPYVTIYGLAQCTRDLQPLACAQCLASAAEKFPHYCRFRKGCQVLYSSCMVRYEIYPFYFPLDSSKAVADAAAAAAANYLKTILHP